LNIEKESESLCGDSDTSSTDGFGIDDIAESDGTDESSCMDEDKIWVFGEEESGLCGEVGYWKDSGWDSQMMNAREVIRGEAVVGKRHDREEESHGHRRIEKELDRPGVPEEYDRRQMEGETNIIFSGEETAEQVAFGHILAFPTQRRQTRYRRERIVLATCIQPQNDENFACRPLCSEQAAYRPVSTTLFESSDIKLGVSLTLEERQEAELLLYTWKDLFVRQLNEMPVTDLVEHRIPVRPNAMPIRARDKIYTREECAWLERKIPEMEKAGIIGRTESPWSHRTQFVRKKDGGLRMVYVFCPINAATILSGYPMKRIEPVVNNLMQSHFSSYFQADAANGYWAVAMYPPHAYRRAPSTHNGQ